jgi:hypothetical protein
MSNFSVNSKINPVSTNFSGQTLTFVFPKADETLPHLLAVYCWLVCKQTNYINYGSKQTVLAVIEFASEFFRCVSNSFYSTSIGRASDFDPAYKQ